MKKRKKIYILILAVGLIGILLAVLDASFNSRRVVLDLGDSVKTGRERFDYPMVCDSERVTRACTYQTSADGAWRSYVLFDPSKPDQYSVGRMSMTDQKQETLYQAPKKEGIWYSVGISSDGQSVYALAVSSTAQHDPWQDPFSLYRMDAIDHSANLVGTWDGSLLDVAVSQNKMVLSVVDKGSHTQSLILTDLMGKPLRTLYEGSISTVDYSQKDIILALQASNIVPFLYAAISPDGQKVAVQVIHRASHPSAWSNLTLFDLQTGNTSTLPTILLDRDILGWSDSETLLLRDRLNNVSKFPLH